MNWTREILSEDIDFNDIFFITIAIDKHLGEILRFKE